IPRSRTTPSPLYPFHARLLCRCNSGKDTTARSGLSERITSTVLCSSYCLPAELRRMQRRTKFFYRMFGEKRIVSRRLPQTSHERNVGTIVVEIGINRVAKTYL